MSGLKRRWLSLGAIALVLVPLLATAPAPAQAQGTSRTFPETGKTVQGRFLQYWNTHGGLAQQGFPISNEIAEVSETDGKTYTVQYFERAVFEYHPENRPPHDVLLSLLGVFLYNQKYGGAAPGQEPNRVAGSVVFPQTGKRVGGRFLQYWQRNGGLAQQGYPISDEFQEVSDLDGKPYRVQYFERAVFEYHPENAGTPHDVLLSQLGTFRFQARYYAGGDQGDADGDGIANAQDDCPAELENLNAVFDTDGCPDSTQTLIDFAAEDINAFWQQTFDDSEVPYDPPTEFVGYTEPIETACGEADMNNAFYCGASHGIYYDLNFLDEQLHTFGDLAPVIIIAHEWGHLVQANLGLLGGRYLSVETELQADCFAGAWAKHADEEGMLEEGDLDEAGAALFHAGDADMPWFDPDAHGPPEQRVRAFADGFQNGVSRCLGGR